jgi:putative adhesin
MRAFTTLGPPALTVRFATGRLAVRTAEGDEDATTVTVDVRPANPDSTADVEHAAATVVEQRGDTIVVTAPSSRGWFGRQPRLDILAVVPAKTGLDVDVKSADVKLSGELGRVAVDAASGDIVIDHAAELAVRTASGDVTCNSVAGDGSVSSASGDAHVRSIAGSGELSTASGDVRVDRVDGDIRVRSASGDIGLGRVGGSATARTASGDVRIASVRRGDVDVDSKSGDVEIGVPFGTAAWLDVSSVSGSVSSALDASDAPGDEVERVTIRARSISGDVRLRRAAETEGGPR